MIKYIFFLLPLFFASNSFALDRIPAEEHKTKKGTCYHPYFTTPNMLAEDCLAKYQSFYSYGIYWKTKDTNVWYANSSNSYFKNFSNKIIYSCPDSDFPNLVDTDQCEEDFQPFVLDQAFVNEYMKKIEDAKGTAEIMHSDFQSLDSFEELETEMNEAVISDQLATSSNDITQDTSDSLIDLQNEYWDNDLIKSQSEKVQNIALESELLLNNNQQDFTTISQLEAVREAKFQQIESELGEVFDRSNTTREYINAYIASDNQEQGNENKQTVINSMSNVNESISNMENNINEYNSNINEAIQITNNVDNSSETIITYEGNTTIIYNIVNNYASNQPVPSEPKPSEPTPEEPTPEEPTPEEPTPEEPEEPEEKSTKNHGTTKYKTFQEANVAFFINMQTSPLLNSANSVRNLIKFPSNSTCPILGVDLSGTILGKNLSTNIHCSLFDAFKGQFTVIFLIIWSFLGFRIFFSA